MIELNKITFQIGDTQSTWFINRSQRRKYRRLVWVIGGLIFGLIFGLIGGLAGGPKIGVITGLIFGFLFAPTGGPDKDAIDDALIQTKLRLKFGRDPEWMRRLLELNLKFMQKSDELDYGEDLKLKPYEIILTDTFRWSLRNISSFRIAGFLISGLIFGLIFGWIFILNHGLAVGMSVGLSIAGSTWLSLGLESGGAKITTQPRHLIRNTILNGIMLTCLFGLFGELIFVITYLLSGGIGQGLIQGLFVGPLFALLLAMGQTGRYILQHYILRYVLMHDGLAPWHLISFLDYSTELLFLRRMGGRYIFIHRLLMEHFAEMDRPLSNIV